MSQVDRKIFEIRFGACVCYKEIVTENLAFAYPAVPGIAEGDDGAYRLGRLRMARPSFVLCPS